MAYTLTIPVVLEPTDTGLTLEMQAIDTAGANVGAAVTSGFVEIPSSGVYQWTGTLPDGHRGGVKFQLSGGGAFQAYTAINPEEAEHTDAKTSTRLATAGYTAPPTAAANAAAVMASVVENSKTFVQVIRGIFAAATGKSSGHSTNAPRYRDNADTKDRISATTDADGRTAVTLDLT